jgi:gliding motility-associated-like protein
VKPLLSFILVFALQLSVNSQCGPDQGLLTVQIQPDFFADEISWDLFQNSVQIASGIQTSYSTCVDTNQCIIFVITDSGGDGICCQFGNGFYTVNIENRLIGNGSVFLSTDTTYFNCPQFEEIPTSDGVTIPTAFSPDGVGNGLNNQFSIIIDETVSTVEFNIFDRWGSMIFSTDTPYFSWDGTYNGKNCISGIYAYQAIVIYSDGKKKIKTGNISLIR